jgi:hypothetical protein
MHPDAEHSKLRGRRWSSSVFFESVIPFKWLRFPGESGSGIGSKSRQDPFCMLVIQAWLEKELHVNVRFS